MNAAPQSMNHLSRLVKLEEDITSSLEIARRYVHIRMKPSPNGVAAGTGGWCQFLNRRTDDPTVTSTASALITLMECGEKPEHENILLGKEFIIRHVREDGGWSKDKYPDFSLTRTTCRALLALFYAGETFNNLHIQRGIEWIIAAQNLDGGWGYRAKDNTSDLGSTAYVMQILTYAFGKNQDAWNSVERAHDWLRSNLYEDLFWSTNNSNDERNRMVYTALVAGAMVDSGFEPTSLGASKEWLAERVLADTNLSPFAESYSGDVRESWTYLISQHALLGLLKMRSPLHDNSITSTAEQILQQQEAEGYWRTEIHMNGVPVWAIFESVTALSLYRRFLVQKKLSLLGLYFVDHIEPPLNELVSEVKALKNQVEEQNKLITNLKNDISVNVFSSLVQTIRKFLLNYITLLVITILIIIGFYFVVREQLSSEIDGIFQVLLAIISLGITIYLGAFFNTRRQR